SAQDTVGQVRREAAIRRREWSARKMEVEQILDEAFAATRVEQDFESETASVVPAGEARESSLHGVSGPKRSSDPSAWPRRNSTALIVRFPAGCSSNTFTRLPLPAATYNPPAPAE